MDGPERILEILDECAEEHGLPMLDNGYIYPAATRLSLHRDDADWAVVIEVFGYMPRAGLPDTTLYTIGSRLYDRRTPEQYVNREAYERYLESNPYNEMDSVWPVEGGPWQDPESCDNVMPDAKHVEVRGKRVPVLPRTDYALHGIALRDPGRIRVYEACRLLAAVAREDVLATPAERRRHVPPELSQILQLEEWYHPDLADDELPSQTETFRQLARVLATGDVKKYRPRRKPNTHWSNWPSGGTL